LTFGILSVPVLGKGSGGTSLVDP